MDSWSLTPQRKIKELLAKEGKQMLISKSTIPHKGSCSPAVEVRPPGLEVRPFGSLLLCITKLYWLCQAYQSLLALFSSFLKKWAWNSRLPLISNSKIFMCTYLVNPTWIWLLKPNIFFKKILIERMNLNGPRNHATKKLKFDVLDPSISFRNGSSIWDVLWNHCKVFNIVKDRELKV